MTWLPGRSIGHLASGLSVIANIMVALMMLHIAFEVAMRYLLGISVPGTLAIVSKYYLPAVVFLPLAVAERRDNHISVEVLTQLLPPAVQRVLTVFAWVLGAVVFATLAYQTALDALKKTSLGAFELDHGYSFYTWPAYYVLPIGFTAVALVLVYKTVVTVIGAPNELDGTSGPAEPSKR